MMQSRNQREGHYRGFSSRKFFRGWPSKSKTLYSFRANAMNRKQRKELVIMYGHYIVKPFNQ